MDERLLATLLLTCAIVDSISFNFQEPRRLLGHTPSGADLTFATHDGSGKYATSRRPRSLDYCSWLGGVQAGCDYQFAGSFVIGIQGDYAWTDAEGSHDSAREFGVAYHSKVNSLASVTGRIGYAWDRFLGYVRGGGAWERDDYWATTIIVGTAYTARATQPGWTIGVGGEYAFA